MSEDTQVVERVDGQEPDAARAETFDAEYVSKLRQEAASYRTRLKELEQQQAERQNAELAEQARWKELAEKRAAEVESLKPVQERYAAMLEAMAASNQRRIESLPDQFRSLVPQYEDPAQVATWLDANAEVLTAKPTMPSLNGGAGIDKPRTTQPILSDAELEIARKMGIPAEEYAKFKD